MVTLRCYMLATIWKVFGSWRYMHFLCWLLVHVLEPVTVAEIFTIALPVRRGRCQSCPRGRKLVGGWNVSPVDIFRCHDQPDSVPHDIGESGQIYWHLVTHLDTISGSSGLFSFRNQSRFLVERSTSVVRSLYLVLQQKFHVGLCDNRQICYCSLGTRAKNYCGITPQQTHYI